MTDVPVAWVKRDHVEGCSGALCRRPITVCVDRLGRVGNGGIVAHEYRCNRAWAPCGARVLVPEHTFRLIAVGALHG